MSFAYLKDFSKLPKAPKYNVRIARKVGYIGGPLAMGEVADVKDYLISAQDNTQEEAIQKAIGFYLKDFPKTARKEILSMGVARRLRP